MRITRQPHENDIKQWKDWHILTVAEPGFSALDSYARGVHGLDVRVIKEFADRINESNEVGSLHPVAPISAIPRQYFRSDQHRVDPSFIAELKRQIHEFTKANRTIIHAERIVVDFHVSLSGVTEVYLEAIVEAFRSTEPDDVIQEVIIFT